MNNIEIDGYERDNLMWVLDLIATRPELSALNSGDWVRQVYFKLQSLPEGNGPNYSREYAIAVLGGV